MARILIVFSWLCLWSEIAAADVLMVADEIPAMEVLAKQLQTAAGIQSKIVTQAQLPADLKPFSAVIVYIHRDLATAVEDACIHYANTGGKLILLHHSISSGKRRNPHWFKFLRVTLPEGKVSQGGYQWIEPATLELVNLTPNHFITTHQVKYVTRTAYTSSESGEQKELPSIILPESEVYLNHVLNGPHTLLMGLKYTDAKTGKTYMQDRAGWYQQTGQGWVMYFMAGHSARDFENPAYAQIVTNAVTYSLKDNP